MMSGLVKGEETSLSKMFEAVGARKADIIDDDDLLEFEQNVCPGCGSCSGMYTAKQHELPLRSGRHRTAWKRARSRQWTADGSVWQNTPEWLS